MPTEFPELPDMPEIPELPDDVPVNEQTIRSLWNVIRGLHALLQAEIHASRALAKVVLEDRENQEQIFGIIQGHHTILGKTIEILAELKGEASPLFDLPRLPPSWKSPETN
jgi:hypothetical protein